MSRPGKKISGWLIAFWFAALVIVTPIVAFLSYYAYYYYTPELIDDPITRALYEAPFQTIPLTPKVLQVGQDGQSVIDALNRAGYRLSEDYSEASVSTRRRSFNSRGITHIFKKLGKASPGCGKAYMVELGIFDDKLAQAGGYTQRGCL